MVKVDLGEFSFTFFWRHAVLPVVRIILRSSSDAGLAPGLEREMCQFVQSPISYARLLYRRTRDRGRYTGWIFLHRSVVHPIALIWSFTILVKSGLRPKARNMLYNLAAFAPMTNSSLRLLVPSSDRYRGLSPWGDDFSAVGVTGKSTTA